MTGHRLQRLAPIDLPSLANRIDVVLAAIEAAAPAATFRLIGSLAEGADTIFADVARVRGWLVDAVLPFPRADYATDFGEPDAIAAFNGHLDAVGSTFELPGQRDGLGGEAAAYERAGRIVLAQSDILLALWDGDVPAGRGGTGQIVAEAVQRGLPVLVIDPQDVRPPALLWSRLNAHELGPEGLETVARGDLSTLPRLLAAMAAGDDRLERAASPLPFAQLVRRPLMLAYPLLLAISGVRRLRRTDFASSKPAAPLPGSATDLGMDARLAERLRPRFDEADRTASVAAQLFRGAFVSNYALAALAVTLSLVGLVTSGPLKTLLAFAEFASIAAILLITHAGSRSGWHARWLRRRRLAERLRCLEISALLGDLMLRDDGAAFGDERTVARSLGLPSIVVDAAYLAMVHGRLLGLLDDQIAYRRRESAQMHRLEHRLHRFGGTLFVIVAIICGVVFAVETLAVVLPHGSSHFLPHVPMGVTLLSASLPAIGAAIYAIRMQGDFAGAAERNAALVAQLDGIRTVAMEDPPTFDALIRLVRRTTDLLELDLGQWFHASRARPLALPG